MGQATYLTLRTGAVLLLIASAVVPIALETGVVHAAPSPGGDTTTLAANCSSPSAINENAATPETGNPNVCLVVSNLEDGGGTTPDSIRILSVSGGTLLQPDISPIALGPSGTVLSLSGHDLLLTFTPSPNNTVASFTYAVVGSDDTNSAASTATIPITPVDVAPTLKTTNGSSGTGLTGTYYRTSKDLTTVPDSNDDPGNPTEPAITRLDPQVSFNTSYSGFPQTVWGIPDVNADDFSVRWTGQIKAPADGTYHITTVSDDGVRVWVDGNLVIDHYDTHAPTTDTSSALTFAAGSLHDIEVNYYERGGGEEIQLEWSYTGQGTQLIPAADMYPGTIRPDLTYIDGSPGAVVDDGIQVSDVDSANMTGATVSVSNNCQPSEDVLQFTDQNGITGSYDNGTCTLTLTGSASIANYQAALRSVKYYDSNFLPNTDTRTVQFSVNDGEKDSNGTFRNIVFAGENHPPSITEGDNVSVSMDEDGAPTPFDLTLDATDPDNQSITWSIVTPPSHGIAGVGEPGNSTGISYTPARHYAGTDSFVVRASDGNGGTATITVNVTVTPHTDTDGVSTTTEDAAPNDGDANNDGTSDSNQSNVSSLVNSVTGNYAAVAISDACSLSDVSVKNQSALTTDKGYTYPLGMLNFTADCGTPGFTATITEYYYNPPAGNFVLRKLVNGTYQNVSGASISRQTINGQSVLIVSYQVTDGGPLDADGTANGIIIDPAGPAVSTPTSSGSVTPSAPDTGYGVPTGTGAAAIAVATGSVIILCGGLLLLSKAVINPET
jgi:hypothetical protein